MQGILNDPNAIIDIAVGPPLPSLEPQPPGSGIIFGNQICTEPRRFLFKKAHLSNDDFRIIDVQTKRLVAVSHHWGKNPYAALDPLDLGRTSDSHMGEWESLCQVSGYHGMPSFAVRPKSVSMHGRQYIQQRSSGQHTTFFNVCKQSRLKSMSLRHHYEVCRGETKDVVYEIVVDLSARTFQVLNEQEQQVVFMQKTLKTLIMNAALGHGSEMVIDVAPGVDWTTALAIIMGMQQVGEHFVKDAASNFVVDPMKKHAVDAAIDYTGLGAQAAKVGHMTDQAIHGAQIFNMIKKEFF
eukprot:jgi/Mesvir1/12841/Mv05873-RA.1